jgi:hypothetical protein
MLGVVNELSSAVMWWLVLIDGGAWTRPSAQVGNGIGDGSVAEIGVPLIRPRRPERECGHPELFRIVHEGAYSGDVGH